MGALPDVTWIIGLMSLSFTASAFGNGANDVSNAYATSVAARTLTMPQAGILAMFTEFFGAVVLGSRVTGTIKNGIIDINRFTNTPSALVLAMGCVEFGSASWLLLATKVGFPVSTTQTVVGALVGAGISSGAQVSWGWKKGSVSQIAASWAIAPLISAAIAAVLFGTLKFAILERERSFERALKAIPFYLAFTAAILALFITIEAPGAPSLEELGAGTACGIIFGVFFGALALAYIFFVPYVHRRLVREDTRIRPRHMILGPLLWRDDPPIFWPAKDGFIVEDHYAVQDSPADITPGSTDPKAGNDAITPHGDGNANGIKDPEKRALENQQSASNSNNNGVVDPSSTDLEAGPTPTQPRQTIARYKKQPEPEERFLAPTAHLPLYNPKRLWSWAKYIFLQGVTRDCVTHAAEDLANVHGKAKRYDNRVEHMWTYAQVASAIMMSIAHGSNDVANAIGPWVAAYQTYQSGIVSEDTETPIWILVAAGFLLGAGFWFMGHHIVRSLGNKLTQLSPTRGFAMELGAAITVLMASRLGLPVSTTQCLLGAVCGVAMMNFDAGAVNWKQMGYIFSGWVLTLPSAGFIAGALLAMALNSPSLR
ncbi:hypothetical protein PspLS_01856 [Pyricularia sp. CBS 133598]|nr:hypothetical protein PspLS_01856 [Pyricularia sp. CBS 133598]